MGQLYAALGVTELDEPALLERFVLPRFPSLPAPQQAAARAQVRRHWHTLQTRIFAKLNSGGAKPSGGGGGSGLPPLTQLPAYAIVAAAADRPHLHQYAPRLHTACSTHGTMSAARRNDSP